MGISMSTTREKIKMQMIFVAVMIIIVILFGAGLLVALNSSKSSPSNSLDAVFLSDTGSKIPILQEGGNGNKLFNNKIFIVLIILLIVFLIILFINSSQNKNRQLTEEDFNQYNQQVREARQIANLSDNGQLSPRINDRGVNDQISVDSDINLPGRPSLTGIVVDSPEAMNYDDNINLDDFYKIQSIQSI